MSEHAPCCQMQPEIHTWHEANPTEDSLCCCKREAWAMNERETAALPTLEEFYGRGGVQGGTTNG